MTPVQLKITAWTLLALLVFILFVARLIYINRTSGTFFPQIIFTYFNKLINLPSFLYSKLGLLKLYSKDLSKIAIVIWLCSLPLTGIDFYFLMYSKESSLAGYEILYQGWLSPLVGNFAWFANIFFLYGFFHLIAGSTAVKSTITTAILSFDTFRFDEYLMNEGGSTTPVYGYGWGAVLWFLSIFLLLAAAGKRQIELRDEYVLKNEYEWLRPLGFFFLVVTFGVVGYFSVHDQVIANTAESQRLSRIAFKRGPVCYTPEPMVIEPIHNFSGVLEVVMDTNKIHSARYPFYQEKDLLSWGIPIVRFNHVNYSNKSVSENESMASPTAILYVDEDEKHTIRAKLIEASTNRTVFEQVWERVPMPNLNRNYFCPDYQSFPSSDQQPRKLLMQGLGLSTNERQNLPL